MAIKIRDFIMARPGTTFIARDFSGIEAVLSGYFALSPRYMRLAKMDVHSFYTAYALNQLDGRVATADLPDHSWPDEKLVPHLAAIKEEFKEDRNNLYKHLVHGANFMQGPRGAREKILLETGIEYEVSLVERVMQIYFELFPEIRKWHQTVLQQVEKDGYIRNPFGYIQRFHKVFEYEKVAGKWSKKPGPDANKVIASGPQSTAAGIIKEAMARLYYDRFEEAGQYLRLLVHDELFLEVPVEVADRVDTVVQEEMERPIEALPLPASYNMGPHLQILTEGKRGDRWGNMK
jgi:DNA polymerase I-like protein with 3'-5' exonuclease and polymerase domains